MQLYPKTFSVKETADMLGVSEFTVRRRIQDGQLKAVMDSKKQGYRISEDSVKSFAEKQNLNVGSIWKKDILKFIPVIGGAIAGMDMLNAPKDAQNSNFNDKYQDITDLNVLNAIVERKQAEIDAYNLQIEYQNFKIAQAKLNDDSQAENQFQELIFNLKAKKSILEIDVKDLNIRKAFLENAKKNV